MTHLYLFGSYATGTASATSDIDFVIKGGNSYDDMSETAVLLHGGFESAL